MREKNSSESAHLSSVWARTLMDTIEKVSQDPSLFSAISGAGPVEEFEKAFANATGAKYALALSSCTAALHTALMASGIAPGDEVIVSPYTWGQSVSPVLFTGATPVFADIDPATLTIDPNCVEDRVSKKTKAIIPVHLFGNPADMDGLSSIAQKHGLVIIADAAQAYGALSKNRKMGSLGDAACFSLGRGKCVYGGEGGVLVTNNLGLYERAITLSQHPLRVFRDVIDAELPFLDELGWNYRIHPLAAVLALADLGVADQRLAHRRLLLDIAQQMVESTPGIESIHCHPGDTSGAYGVPLTFNSTEVHNIRRDLFVESLLSEGINIQIGPVRIPIHMRPTFQQHNPAGFPPVPHNTHRQGSCSVAEDRCERKEIQLIDAHTLDRTTTETMTQTLSRLRKATINAVRRLSS